MKAFFAILAAIVLLAAVGLVLQGFVRHHMQYQKYVDCTTKDSVITLAHPQTCIPQDESETVEAPHTVWQYVTFTK